MYYSGQNPWMHCYASLDKNRSCSSMYDLMIGEHGCGNTTAVKLAIDHIQKPKEWCQE